MQYALYLPNFEPWGTARAIAQIAREAEDSGWDGVFIWDNYAGFDAPFADPWISLSAAAVATKRIRLGALITPLARRRPQKFALETATLDHLSDGRLVIGVGTGDGKAEWDDFGEETDHKVRGDMLDEALEVVTGLWTGETYSHDGPHYHLHNVRYQTKPLQQPRIPIWVAGIWPHKRPMQRMARWDGMFPLFFTAKDRDEALAQFTQTVNTVRSLRTSGEPFSVLALGATPLAQCEANAAAVRPWAASGATWWLETLEPNRTEFGGEIWSYEQLRAKVLEGPPRID